MNLRRAMKRLRSRPELFALAIGALLFIGGALKLVFDQGRASTSLRSRSIATPDAGVDARTRVGPSPGESLAGYTDRKKKLLGQRAASSPRVSGFAVVSFDGYRKSEEAEQFVATEQLKLDSAWIRVPFPGFDPVELKSGEDLGAAVEAELKRIDRQQRQELDDLEAIIPTVTDPAFKKVYEEDARRLRKTVQLLAARPSVVFAVVVRGTNANLARAGRAEGTRLVDVSDDPNASPDTHVFTGILPEETGPVFIGKES